jgi:predicted phosphodiesterase
MKALILSDIHSNIAALEAIWNKELDSDVIYCAGDLVDYGPEPKAVLDWLRQHQVQSVVGNHDLWVVLNYQSGRSLEDVPLDERAWVHHNASLLDDADIKYLEGLPGALTVEIDGLVYGITHLYEDYKEIPDAETFLRFRLETFSPVESGRMNRIIMGHTHIQGHRDYGRGRVVLNPGSVSYRRLNDPDRRAHYATITDGTVEFKRVEYDFEAVGRQMAQVQLKTSETAIVDRFFGTAG